MKMATTPADHSQLRTIYDVFDEAPDGFDPVKFFEWKTGI